MLPSIEKILCYSLAPSQFRQFLNRETKQAQQAKPGQPSQACRGGFRNERQAVIARIAANQAKASCVICKNRAIVLGLAGDEDLGFTRIQLLAT